MTYTCHECGFTSADPYTVDVINDVTGICPHCSTPALPDDFTLTSMGVTITDPTFDESGRFEVGPDYYGGTK